VRRRVNKTRQASRRRASIVRTGAAKLSVRRSDAVAPPVVSNDGGAWSLLGYMYQLVGSAALRVSLERGEINAGEASARIVVEEVGQDAIVIAGQNVRLVQFKHSASERPISPSELADVLRTLNESQEALPGAPQYVKWVLQTNRPLSTMSEQILAGRLHRGKHRVSREALKTIETLGPRLTKERHTFKDFEGKLLASARRFGVDDSTRVADSVTALLERVVQKPPGQRIVRLDDVEAALSGFPEPLSIRGTECAARLGQSLAELAAELGHVDLNLVVPRTEIVELLAREEGALAVVIGPGGCGKTLSVIKALHDAITRRQKLGGVLLPGPNPPRRSLPELVGTWRSVSPMQAESLEASLRRIRIANGGLPRPVLLLALDGIDESRWDERSDAHEVIAYFRKMHNEARPADALLLVTCRTRDQFRTYVSTDGVGGRQLAPIQEAILKEFTDDEFRAAWGLWFPGEPIPETAMPGEPAAVIGSANGAGTSLVARALRHPVLLGLLLREFTAEERSGLLAGGAAEWRKLVEKYVDWFELKAARRLGRNDGLVREVLRAAAVATAGDSTATYDLDRDWVGPAVAGTGAATSLLRAIFFEAVTAGMIDSDGTRFERPRRVPAPWTWHFPFIAEHLSVTL
jgi:hypothetical protein